MGASEKFADVFQVVAKRFPPKGLSHPFPHPGSPSGPWHSHEARDREGWQGLHSCFSWDVWSTDGNFGDLRCQVLTSPVWFVGQQKNMIFHQGLDTSPKKCEFSFL